MTLKSCLDFSLAFTGCNALLRIRIRFDWNISYASRGHSSSDTS